MTIAAPSPFFMRAAIETGADGFASGHEGRPLDGVFPAARAR